MYGDKWEWIELSSIHSVPILFTVESSFYNLCVQKADTADLRTCAEQTRDHKWNKKTMYTSVSSVDEWPVRLFNCGDENGW